MTIMIVIVIVTMLTIARVVMLLMMIVTSRVSRPKCYRYRSRSCPRRTRGLRRSLDARNVRNRWHGPVLALAPDALLGAQVAQEGNGLAPPLDALECLLATSEVLPFDLVLLVAGAMLSSLRSLEGVKLPAIGFEALCVLMAVQQRAQALDPGHPSEKGSKTRRAVLVPGAFDGLLRLQIPEPQLIARRKANSAIKPLTRPVLKDKRCNAGVQWGRTGR